MTISLTNRTVRNLGFLAACAAGIITLADYLLEFNLSHQAGTSIIEPEWIEMASWRFSLSLNLCAFVIPLYLAGFFMIHGLLKRTHPRSSLLLMGLFSYGVVMGSPLIHGVMSLNPLIYSFLVGTGDSEVASELISSVITPAVLPVFLVHYLLTWVAAPLVLFILILTGRTVFPRPAALLNPLVFLLFFMGLHLMVPQIGVYLLPGSINKANTLLFLYTAFSFPKLMEKPL